MSNTYSTFSFFIGRNLAGMPLDLFMPLLFLVIMYFPVHLDNRAFVFFWAVLISELVYFMSASYGLLLSATFKDMTVVMALVPVVIVPLMLVGGFFTNLNNVPKLFYPLEYISMFKYGFQTYIQNNYRRLISCPTDGHTCDILVEKYQFKEAFWVSMMLMAVIGVAMRLLAFIALYFLSNPSRVILNKNKKRRGGAMGPFQPGAPAQPYVANAYPSALSAQNLIIPNTNVPNQLAYGYPQPASSVYGQRPLTSNIQISSYPAPGYPQLAGQSYYANNAPISTLYGGARMV